MKNVFNSVKLQRFKSNFFDLSHDVKLTCKMGRLIPIMTMEAVPGDTFQIKHQILARFQSVLAPIMHNIDIYHHSFFVPNRILWPNWEKFMTPNVEGVVPNYPTINKIKGQIGSLIDYFGFPVTDYDLPRISALPFLAYNKIYNEYYRDQNLIDELPDEALDGDNSAFRDWLIANPEPQFRAWRPDYFTACLPWPQKGPTVLLPVGGFNDVDVYADASGYSVLNPPKLRTAFEGDEYPYSGQKNVVLVGRGSGAPNSSRLKIDNGAGIQFVDPLYDPAGTLKAKTSDMVSTVASINNFRAAMSLQQYYERAAVAGTRYTEYLSAFFGVRSQDSRLQRPEYICGGKQPMIISEVIQTSKSEGDQPLGSLAGHGISAGGSNDRKFRVPEHGWIITLMSVVPKAGYQDGIPKHYQRFDPLDYLNPMFARLGEQEVLNKEVFYSDDDSYNDAIFGYIPRYSEYRFHSSRVAGDMRTSLDFYHMNRKFSNTDKPILNKEFIDCRPTTRIFPVISEDNRPLLAHVVNNVIVKRQLPRYGTPALIV